MRIVIVGAGPGGISAAVTAAKSGADVTLVDENPKAGGQIWKGAKSQHLSKSGKYWIEQLQNQNLTFMFGWTVFDVCEKSLLISKHDEKSRTIDYDFLILACGAREIFMPFPGWTLPNIFGVGGVQSLLKMGLPVKNKNVVVAGTGPLLFAAASSLKKENAIIPVIAEQTSLGNLTRFLWQLKSHPGKMMEAFNYRFKTLSSSFATGTWVKSASGSGKLEEVTLTDGERDWAQPCDILACSYGLTPNLELAQILGCELNGNRISTDEFGKTTVNTIFAVGEGTGVGGAEKAILEGRIAASKITGSNSLELKKNILKKNKMLKFTESMEKYFQIRNEIKTLCKPKTIVCRCEDVTYSQLQHFESQRSAKLHTRMSMGACQGKVCSTTCSHLFNWEQNQVRPPLQPVDMGSIASALEEIK